MYTYIYTCTYVPVHIHYHIFRNVHECNSANTNNCSHNCTNTIGGYVCSCPNGYNLSSNNFTCDKEGQFLYCSEKLVKLLAHTAQNRIISIVTCLPLLSLQMHK